MEIETPDSRRTRNPSTSRNEQRKILEYSSVLSSNHNARRHSHGYWVGTDVSKLHQSFADPNFAAQLPRFFLDEPGTGSVIDVGGGDGMYTEALARAGLFVSCYDGNPVTQEVSRGRCAVLDFSQAVNLPVTYDWALCLKVGKHVPKAYEAVFIRNLDRLNSKGIIISWGGATEAILRPGEPSHFNEKTDLEIIEIFNGLGYVHDLKGQARLRADTDPYGSLRDRLLVFRKSGCKLLCQ